MITCEADQQIEVKIGEKQIPVWIYGAANKPTILLIHGYPHAFSTFFGDLPMKYLSKRYRIAAFDLPGFGTSKKVSVSHQEMIEQVLNELKISDPVVLFGLSYGGALSLSFAHDHPQQVQAVIIGGTPYFNKLIRLGLRTAKLPTRATNKKVFEFIDSFLNLKKPYLSEITQPVLLLYSKNDTVGTWKMGEKLRSVLPKAELKIAQNRTHGWLVHRIDESGFLEAIETFLKKINFT